MSGRSDEDAERLGEYVDVVADGSGVRGYLAAEDEARIDRVARAFEHALAMPSDALEALLASDEAPPRALQPPRLPEDYELIEEIGHGGMGVVYKARQKSLDRIVAVKVLHPGDRLFGHAIRRFQREARLLARLRHPNIVRIHEVGEVEDQVYFTMEWIDGRPMNELLAQGRLKPTRAVKLVRQVAAAVAYVHDHGLVHRDLKPANILVDDEDVAYVTDFGLALELESDAGLTLTGQVVGTPAYMSPEQARGRTEDVGEGSDVYALGVILYELLTGKRPFQGRSPAEQVYAVIHEEPVRPRKIDRAIPEDLQVIGLKAMGKRTEQRYPTARALLEDLERFEAGRPIRARPPSRSYRFGRWTRRNHGRIGWFAAGMAVLALVLFTFLRTPPAAPDARPLGPLAARLAEDGHLEAATRVYEQAVALADPPDPALYGRLTELRRQLAKAMCASGQPEKAVALLERAYDEGVRLYGKTAWKHVGPVAWALAAAHAQAEPDTDATSAFRGAFQTWHKREEEAARRVWRAGGPSPGGPFNTDVAQAIVDDLLPDLTQGGAARTSAIRQVIALTQVSNLSARPIARLVSEVPQHGAPLVRALLEIALAGEMSHPTAGAWAFSSLRNPFRRVADTSVEAALAQVAGEEAHPHVQRAAALLLLDLADIPLAAGFLAMEPERAEVDPATAVAVWNELRALDTETAYLRRVELAAQVMADVEKGVPSGSQPSGTARVARQMLPGWFNAHTGAHAAKTADAMRAWLDAHREESPRLWLGRALACPAPDASGARWLLAEYRNAQHPRRLWIHNLLRLIVPADKGRLPVAGLRGMHANDLLPRWQDLVLGTPRFERLRLARLTFRAGRWTLRPEDEVHLPVTLGKTIQLEHEAPLRERHASTYVGFTLPGLMANEARPAGSRYLTMQAVVERRDAGLKLRVQRIVRGVRASEYSSYSGTSGNEAGVGYAMSPDVQIGGWSDPDPFRHEFSLVVLEQEEAEDAPWDLDAWQARLVADWSKLAAGVETGKTAGRPNAGIGGAYRFLMDHQQTVMNMGAVAGRIPLPRAVAAMQTVQGELGGLSSQRRLVVFARLMAGDEATLSDEKSVAALGRLDDDSYAADTLGRSGEAWIRLLVMTQSEPIRAFALERLKELDISARAMGDLLDAKRGGALALPAWLETRLAEQPVEDRSWFGLVKAQWPWFGGAALVLLGMLLALLFALRPRRAPGQGLVPAAWLIAIGVLLASVQVSACGFDHLPDPLGYGLAALGAALLARELRHPRRYLPALLFAAAGALDVARQLVELPGLLVTLEAVCALGGVVLLPGLGRQLRESEPDARKAPAEPLPPIGRHLWILAAIVFVLVLVTTASGRGGVSLVGIFAWGGLLFGTYGAARVLVRMASAPGRPRGLPILFWLFYILPNGFLIGATLWVQLTGSAGFQITGDWLLFAFFAAGLCVLWAVLSTVKAARIRATYLRLRAARTV